MRKNKRLRRIAGIGAFSAGLVLSMGVTGDVGEVAAEERVKVHNKYDDVHVYTQMDVLKALGGYNSDNSREGLLEYGLKTGDMSLFYAVDALLRPAFYDVVDEKFERNKFYYGALIDQHLQTVTGLNHSKKEDKKLWELVEKYKKAPGAIPYVIGFTDTKQNADFYGVEITPIEFFTSKWNHPDVLIKGVFSHQNKKMSTEEKTDSIYEEYKPIEGPPQYQDETNPEEPEIDNQDNEGNLDGEEGKDETIDDSVGEKEPEEQNGGINYLNFDKDDYFDKIEWIDRKGIVSLSIYPKFHAFNKEDGKLDEQHIKHSFDLIEGEYRADEKWDNTDSMRVQYECHVYFARDSKVPWNIETHRTEIRFVETVLKSCNP